MLPLNKPVVTQIYGVPGDYYKDYHTGIDFISDDGRVFGEEGRVRLAAWARGKGGADPKGWGNYVIIIGKQYDYIYAHLATVIVAQNEIVKAGDLIGIMGNTGNTKGVTGIHLHYEVRQMPWTDRNEINPAEHLGIENKLGPVQKIQRTTLQISELVTIRRHNQIFVGGLVNGKAWGPVRDIMQGYDVAWDEAKREVVVSGGPAEKLKMIEDILK